MKRFRSCRKTGKSYFVVIVCSCLMFMAAACSDQKPETLDIVIGEGEAQSRVEEVRQTDAGRIAAVWRTGYEEAVGTDLSNTVEVMQKIIDSLGKSGYAAVDSENQVDMANAGQVLAFCSAIKAKENAELTIIEVVNIEGINIKYTDMKAVDKETVDKRAAACEFRKYDFHSTDGRVEIDRGYYCFDAYGNLVREDFVSYPADIWQYTEEGYLIFAGSYYADDYYIISLTDAPEYAALRVVPLDAECREMYQKYIAPVGYGDNNLFLVNWTEEDFGALDFYDVFDRFYPMLCQQSFPYTASENPGIGAVYQIAEKEFEDVVKAYLNIDIDALRSKTVYFPAEKTYEYKPRGFYEIGTANMPYPEVVCYNENSDDTVTLLVNAVFPYEYTSKAFSHEVVIRTLADGGFQYVSNKIVEGDYDAWWYTARLTEDEWEEIYVEGNVIEEPEDSLWYLPQAEDCLITRSEQNALKKKALEAAGQVREVYRDVEIEDGASYASNVKVFDSAQRKEVVALLGKAGLVSVTEDVSMENYHELESFYEEYKNGHDAMVTVFEVNRDGLIGAVTLIHKNDMLQIYYVGVGWKEGGVPVIKNTLVSDVSQISLTEKGYFIYEYKEQLLHAAACQYWRVRPLSEKCRELTRKYVAGVSFVNYNAFAIDWNSSNVEDILMPCMFADIYRMDTGENLRVENDQIPAELYERVMMTYFPVTREQLRSKCGYDAGSDSYPYEMIFAQPYAPFGEVVDFRINGAGDGDLDGTITLTVDGVWIDYNTDCAFTNEIVVRSLADGKFRYLSNRRISN